MATDSFVKESPLNSEELLKEKPLLGVPFTFKECISVSGMPYTAGLVKRVGTVGEEDAPTIRNMRQAGAIPLGGSNVSEACRWFESENNVYGLTRNPYNLDHTVGGSSGGEGAIVGSGASVIGVGTDGGGSLRYPAFCNGLFSHKHSADLIPSESIYPLPQGPGSYMVAFGPMCRYAVDMPLVVDILAGHSHVDVGSFTQQVRTVNVSSLKVVSIADDGGSSATEVCDEIRAIQSGVEKHLKEELHASVETASVPAFKNMYQLYMDLAGEDTGPTLCEMFANGDGRISPFWELGKWLFRQSDYMLASIVQGIMEKTSSPPKFGEDNAEAHRQRDELKQELEDLIGDNGVLLYPTRPIPACKHYQTWFHLSDFVYTCVFSVLRMPATTVPIGRSTEGLPLGLQIVAKEGNDHLTMAVAMELERTMTDCRWSCPPLFPLTQGVES